MDKKTLNEARMAYESAGCALEKAICEFLSSHGEKGADISGWPLTAVYTGSIAGTPDEKIVAARFLEGSLEGRNKEGEWLRISAFNAPAEYCVRAGLLSAALETEA